MLGKKKSNQALAKLKATDTFKVRVLEVVYEDLHFIYTKAIQIIDSEVSDMVKQQEVEVIFSTVFIHLSLKKCIFPGSIIKFKNYFLVPILETEKNISSASSSSCKYITFYFEQMPQNTIT